MKLINEDSTRNNKPNRTRLIGYVLFGITVLACAAWIIYKYYAIRGWEAWDMSLMGDRYRRIIADDLSITLIIVSFLAGVLSTKKRSKIIHFLICYVYLLLLIWIIPLAWSFSTKDYTLLSAFQDIISFCSLFSIAIIPCFSISSLLAFCINKLRNKAADRSPRN